MFDWIEKYKKRIVIFIIFAIIVVPVTIHIIFKIPALNSYFEAEWTAGEFLGYYGTVLAFLGTVVLGALAIWQNKEIQNQSIKYTEHLENIEGKQISPRFIIDKVNYLKNEKILNIRIKNITSYQAYQVSISDLTLKHNDNVINAKQIKFKYNYIKSNEDVLMQFAVENFFDYKNVTFIFTLNFVDERDNQRSYKFSGLIPNEYPDIYLDIKEFIATLIK